MGENIPIKNENRRGILIASHDMNEIKSLCDRVYVMVKGKIIAEGSPEEISTLMKMPVEMTFILSDGEKVELILEFSLPVSFTKHGSVFDVSFEYLNYNSTMSVNIKEIALSLALTYIIFTLPVIISSYISVVFASEVSAGFLIVGIILSLVVILLIGTFLGLLIKNVFIAQGIMPLLSWVFLLIAPVYYSVEHLDP